FRSAAEADALRAVLPAVQGSPLLDRLRLPDALAPALAAALGDDVLADALGQGDVHWAPCPSPPEDDPPLPDGAVPLAREVDGAGLLDRRLAQIGIVDPADADALRCRLRPGQRLVSPAGDLWRWDGFVRRAAAGEAATHLRNRRRLA